LDRQNKAAKLKKRSSTSEGRRYYSEGNAIQRQAPRTEERAAKGATGCGKKESVTTGGFERDRAKLRGDVCKTSMATVRREESTEPIGWEPDPSKV